MANGPRYPIAQGLAASCVILNIDQARVLRRAGLSEDFADDPNATASVQDYFRIWEAVAVESDRDDVVLHLAREAAHIQIVPEVIAFSCSPNVETGLRRLAVYKPLIAPVELSVVRTEAGLKVTKRPLFSDVKVPPALAAFDVIYLTELIRITTAKHVCPTCVTLPEIADGTVGMSDYLGVEIAVGDSIDFTIRTDDAALPLLSASTSLWDAYEPRLREALAEVHPRGGIESRVGLALIDLIAGGSATIDAVSRKLGVSRRSLQRELTKEGTSYSKILDSTRASLAYTYLSRDELSIDEISFLLGYKDPNSFYRSFQGWTGKTPSEVRSELVRDD